MEPLFWVGVVIILSLWGVISKLGDILKKLEKMHSTMENGTYALWRLNDYEYRKHPYPPIHKDD